MIRRLPSAFQTLMTAIALALILTAGYFLKPLNEKREQYRLTDSKPLENAPPQLVISSTALGGLRGLAINYLWMRAIQLRDRGKHYEIVQLYDWISKLEPRIDQIWIFTAWEMSYNISVTVPTKEDRWRWILKGVEQLRDYGIQYNPESPKLYWRLAWIIMDKIGTESMDEFRFFYQKQLIQMMIPLVGKDQNLQELADAVRTESELLQDKSMQNYIAEFEKHNIDILTSFFSLRALGKEKTQIARALLTSASYEEQMKKLSAYLRAKRLREEWKMEPAKMLAVEEKYTRLDWRLPAPHALYWAEEGIKIYQGIPKEEKHHIDEKNMDRLQNIALNQIFEYGYALAEGDRGLICIPNFQIIPSVHRTFEEIQKKWDIEYGRSSHESFLNHVVWQSYMYGNFELAQKYYEILQKKFPRPNYEQALDQYVVKEVGRQVTYFERRHIIESYIISTINRAYEAILFNPRKVGVLGEDLSKQANGLFRLAKVLYREYLERQGDNSQANEYEKPRSLAFFEQAALRRLKETVINKYGAEKGEQMWTKLSERYSKLRIVEEKPSDESAESAEKKN